MQTTMRTLPATGRSALWHRARHGSAGATSIIASRSTPAMSWRTLGNEFNHMAMQLRESYGSLERKVQERTHQLHLANQAKSRFLAAASHDLRQPLHALNLFIAQLSAERDQAERDRLVGRMLAAGDPSPGISSGEALILPERHPACRRREARPGSCTERENLGSDHCCPVKRRVGSLKCPGYKGL